MEGVPERLEPLPPATCARRLPTTTPGRPLRAAAAAISRLDSPAESVVLASKPAGGIFGGNAAEDNNSPVDGLLQRSPAAEQVLALSLSYPAG